MRHAILTLTFLSRQNDRLPLPNLYPNMPIPHNEISMVDLKLLKDVLAIIEENSFTLAAQRRNVTQPAFSRRIQKMENWLGHKIVDRSGPNIEVTQAALRMETRIRRLVNQIGELKIQYELEYEKKRHVIFTMSHTHSIYLFSFLLKQLRNMAGDEEPVLNYGYTLKSAYKAECLGIFMRGDADVFICDEEAGKTSIPSSFRCVSTPLGSDCMIPVVDSSWSKGQAQFPNGLPKRLPLIVYPEDSYLWSLIATRCMPKLTESYTFEIVCQTALSAGIRDLVLAGMGIGWLPKSAIIGELKSGRLVALDEQLGRVDLDLICYMSEEAIQSGLGTLFEALGRCRAVADEFEN
jgi:DNA-binding transcriptional LysR family regulator